MSLFLNTLSLHNHYLDCCALDVSETIERDCLSVLHKLHDQVNGLQLVQVVVQPLARLFNPASLAALVSNLPLHHQQPTQSIHTTSAATITTNSTNNQLSSNQSSSNASTPSSQHAPPFIPAGSSQQIHDLDGGASSYAAISHHQSSTGATLSTANSAHLRSSSNSQSITAASSNALTSNTNTSTTNTTTTSTYMMSPDTAQALIARLDTDRDVNWLMEIIGYGLSLPFSITGEQDSVKDCCTIYCEWLTSALLPYSESNEDTKYQQLSKLVPVPIRKEPNHYARKMLSHLYNVFLPRQTLGSQKENQDANLTAVSRQAVLCHRVLRTIETIAQNPANLMDNQTWDHLLALLLTVNDKLLSAPTEPDDIGTQLHDRILGVLFELILLASAKSIPTQNVWKSFYSMTLNWRHRPGLVDHWKRITLLLTKRIVFLSSVAAKSGEHSSDNINEMSITNTQSESSHTPIAIEQVVATMGFDNLAQTWYRFLNLIGNPVELSNPNIISRTDEFYHSACASDSVLDPRQHPCLNLLPQIFMNSMKGLRNFIEAFLGQYTQLNTEYKSSNTNDPQTPDRPPASYLQSSRGSIVSMSGKSTSTSITTFIQSTLNMQQVQHPQPTPIATPTQPKKTGIKSIGKSVLPFTSGTLTGPAQDATHNMHQSIEPSTKPRSGSSHKLPKLAQPRPSLNNLPNIRPPHPAAPTIQQQFKLFSERPKCNSILHVFGDWLFSATLIGSDLNQKVVDDGSSSSIDSSSTTTEVSGFSATYEAKNPKSTVSGSQQSSYFSDQHDHLASESAVSNKILLDQTLTANSFEAGQAEAMMILCRIFSSKSLSEDISPTYLSRFYLCLQHCLNSGINGESSKTTGAAFPVMKRQLIASVLVNSTSLLQKDLDGINLLVPSFMKAIEFVFEYGDRDEPVQPPRQHSRSGSIRSETLPYSANINNYDLRRACIMTLLNLLAYPFHFQELVIRNCLNDTSPTTTFGSLRPRLLKLLFIALQTEMDPTNMQVLFGALSLTIHDLAFYSKRPLERKESIRSRHKSDSQSLNSGDQDSFGYGSGRRDAIATETSFVFNSTVGFLVKSLHVTCHLLINIWKHDTQVSLAGLEFLTAVARVSASSGFMEQQSNNGTCDDTTSKLNNSSRIDEMRSEYKQTTKWICDYICNQCSRPPPAHSRDMHSTIVAAYQCLSVWFHYHPYLLNDRKCVDVVMEVIELGVSGQKSKTHNINPTSGISNQTVINKNEKIMKPSSMRVREAAESLLNICLIGSRSLSESMNKMFSSHDSPVDEHVLTKLFGGPHSRDNQNLSLKQLEAYKSFKYFSDENSTIFSLLEAAGQDQMTRDSLICLLRTPFGKHCWRIKFKYYAEKSKDKIIANKALGLIKRPFHQQQQCTTPTTEMRLFPLPNPTKSNYYFNNSARYFPQAIDELAHDELDHLVTSLDDYSKAYSTDYRLKSDLDKMTKIYSHQMLAEQKVSSECSIRVKRVDAEEPQPNNELELARILVTHLGLETALIPVANDDRAFGTFVDELRQLDKQSVRTCDSVSIFYVRKSRTSAREILESVRERQNVSLSFFEWLLDLGEPTVVKQHSRWTGKVFNGTSSSLELLDGYSDTMSKNQMLMSNHGGAIFDGERMTLYWSDMCQELSFMVHHKIETVSSQELDAQLSKSKLLTTFSETTCPGGLEQEAATSMKKGAQEYLATHHLSSTDHNSDGQSVSSFASDISSQSSRALKLQPQITSPEDQHHQPAHLSQPRHSISMQKKKSTLYASGLGCDTNIIICWLESHDDLQDVPYETLLSVGEMGHLLEYQTSSSSAPARAPQQQQQQPQQTSAGSNVRYFISPMRNGLYRVNLTTSFGRQWLALPLVDGMTVTKGALASLIRESVLNLCRRRRLDADSYQPPHLRRRIKIQEICNQFKTSSRHELAEFYNSLYSSRGVVRSHPSASQLEKAH